LTTLSGSEFQTVGAATEKARLAKLFEFEERLALMRGYIIYSYMAFLAKTTLLEY